MIFKNLFKKQNNNNTVYLVGTTRAEVRHTVTVAVFQNENDAVNYIIDDLGFEIVYGGIFVKEDGEERQYANIKEVFVQ